MAKGPLTCMLSSCSRRTLRDIGHGSSGASQVHGARSPFSASVLLLFLSRCVLRSPASITASSASTAFLPPSSAAHQRNCMQPTLAGTILHGGPQSCHLSD